MTKKGIENLPTQATHRAAVKEETATQLSYLRREIDDIDDDLVCLLNRRAQVAIKIGRVKAIASQQAYAPGREQQLLARILEYNPGPLLAESLRLIYKEIVSACLALESPLQVAYLGPEATFTHEATKMHFGMSAQLNPLRSISEVFNDVESGRCEYGVVPVENSNEGIVNHTLDQFMSSDLGICAEVLLGVSHHLLSSNAEISGITKVYSHPQALAQCRVWLERNLPDVPLIDVSSTARAAQLASEDPFAAAVASDLAASLYELPIAHSHLQDHQGNITRFLIIGRDAADVTNNDKTSLMLGLNNASGDLHKVLACFANAGIKMHQIESRPSRQKAWDYLFFIDIAGHKAQSKVKAALQEIKSICKYSRVLGSYPRSETKG